MASQFEGSPEAPVTHVTCADGTRIDLTDASPLLVNILSSGSGMPDWQPHDQSETSIASAKDIMPEQVESLARVAHVAVKYAA